MKQLIAIIKQRAVTALAVVVLAGAGLGFAPVAAHADTNADLEAQIQALLAIIAQLQGQMGQSTTGYYSGNCVFTRDLGYGMSGSDVACLQNYLITSGYSIPAGPTGNYYSQTQTAVAVWQAAHGVYPANGFFSAMSRTTYQSLTTQGTNGNDNNNNDNGNLRGGQASLESYNLVADSTTLREGTNNRDAATIRVRASGGDVELNTIALRVQAKDSGSNVDPWDYFDSIVLFDEDSDKKIASESVDRSSDWDRVSNGSLPTYEITFKHLNDIIREDDTAHIQILLSADTSLSNSELDQSFDLFVPNRGIEGEDSTGRNRTAGDDSDTVRIRFDN
ncbi:MAG TPA: peptidoglycan-binding protein [Candidatus Paceibacterota bacterium]|nr:peptidoglycan-binding protein [Candidatus Paceibacterota bacterium]